MSAAINPYAWWARYIPQLSMVPLAVVLASWPDRARLVALLRVALLAAVVVNAGVVAKKSVEGGVQGNANVRRQLEDLRSCGRPIDVYFGGGTSARTRFREIGLPYREAATAEELTCPDKFAVDMFQGVICACAAP